MNKLTLIFLIGSLASFSASAEDTASEVKDNANDKSSEKKLWKNSVELGFVSTSGNTNTDTLNVKASALTEREKWRHKIEGAALKSSTENITTAEKYNLKGQSDYKLTKQNYLFANLAYEDDKFSGYQYRVSEAIGYGRRVVDDEDLKLDLEIGTGARQSKLDSGDTGNEGTILGAIKLDWKVSKTSQFNEVLTVENGSDARITKSVTSISSQINGKLSMKFTYTYKNTSEVPLGVDKTDTETAVMLVYNF